MTNRPQRPPGGWMRRLQVARMAYEALTCRLAGVPDAPLTTAIVSGPRERTVRLASVDYATALALREEQAAAMQETANVITLAVARRLAAYGRSMMFRTRQWSGDAEGLVLEAVRQGVALWDGSRRLIAHSKRAIARHISQHAKAMRPAPEGWTHVDAADVGTWDNHASDAPRPLPPVVTRHIGRLPAPQAAALTRFLEDGTVSTDQMRALATLQAACGRPAPVHWLCRREHTENSRSIRAWREQAAARKHARVHGIASRALSKGWAPGQAALRAGVGTRTMAAVMRKMASTPAARNPAKIFVCSKQAGR